MRDDGTGRRRGGRDGHDDELGRRVFLSRLAGITVAGSVGAMWHPVSAAAERPPHSGSVPGGASASAPTRWSVRTSSPRSRPGPGIRPGPRTPLPDPAPLRQREPETLSVAEAASLIRSGDLSPVELVEACLRRVERYDGIYVAFNLVLPDEALARAERLGRGPWRGPLHGIPLAIKDNFYTAGITTTANSHIFESFVPDFDATAVAWLKEDGAIALGKTQMGPLATSRATTPDGEWTTVNAWAPHDPSIQPGGSSSGSATSVAAGMSLSSIGTQTGGSVVRPALEQGLTGLKPTMGRVSVYGVIPLTYTRDHPGPIARDAHDAAILLQSMAGPDPMDPRTQGLPPVPDYLAASQPDRSSGGPRASRPLRVGVLPGYLDAEALGPSRSQVEEEGLTAEERQAAERDRRLAQEVVQARRRMLATLEEVGLRVVEVPFPDDWEVLSGRAYNEVRRPERSEPFLEVLRDDVRKFGVSLSSWINGLLLTAPEYVRGQRAKLLLASRIVDDVFQRCDVVVQTDAYRFDIVGLPQVAFPIGFETVRSAHPLPIGALLGGKPYREDDLLAVAAAFQAVTDHHRMRPALPEDFPAAEGLRRDLERDGARLGPRRRPGAVRGRSDVREVAEFGE